MASKLLAAQIDAIRQHKKEGSVEFGISKGNSWGIYTEEKYVGDILRFMGSFVNNGYYTEEIHLGIIISPEVINNYVEWFRCRRGELTTTVEKTLVLLSTLLINSHGYIPQRPDLFHHLNEIPGLVGSGDVDRAKRDWREACQLGREHILKTLKANQNLFVQGRDPFEPILSVLEAPEPARTYYSIVTEIRSRMPDKTYPSRWAEAKRALFMHRLLQEMAFRLKNDREMLLRLPGHSWVKASILERKKIMQIGFQDEGKNAGRLIIRAPRSCFKNASSRVLNELHPDRPFILGDYDGLYSEDLCAMRLFLVAGLI